MNKVKLESKTKTNFKIITHKTKHTQVLRLYT